jgi:hypothetical protein
MVERRECVESITIGPIVALGVPGRKMGDGALPKSNTEVPSLSNSINNVFVSPV